MLMATHLCIKYFGVGEYWREWERCKYELWNPFSVSWSLQVHTFLMFLDLGELVGIPV